MTCRGPLIAVSLLLLFLDGTFSFAPRALRVQRQNGNFPMCEISTRRMISSGFSYSDGKQLLVSVQKPIGIVLEQDSETGLITVTAVDPNGSAGKGGVRVGDILMAVQNASTENVDLDDVLAFIVNGPRVINLRLMRAQ